MDWHLIERRSTYQSVQSFIGIKTDILNCDTFRYSLHKVRKNRTVLKLTVKLGDGIRVCVSFSSKFTTDADTVGWVFRPVKTRPRCDL